jgi:hypothetical protein
MPNSVWTSPPGQVFDVVSGMPPPAGDWGRTEKLRVMSEIRNLICYFLCAHVPHLPQTIRTATAGRGVAGLSCLVSSR